MEEHSTRTRARTLADVAAGARRPRGVLGGGGRRGLGLVVILVALVLACGASLRYGANPLTFTQVWDGVVHRDDSEAAIIVWTLRFPRTIVGVVVGAAFGLSGALIQALTRNPLADPGILGVNAGAGFAVTLGVAAFGVSGVRGYVWFAFLGAMAATVLVYLIGSAGTRAVSPAQLVLAGVALSAVLGGVTTFLNLVNPEVFDALRSWGVGSISGTSLSDTWSVLGLLVLGMVLALALSGSLNAVALGDDLAAALGTNIARTRALGIIAVTLLAGGGTALTGGIGFVGLMVPHAVRWIVGPDQRWIMAYTVLAAPVLVLVADVIGRVIARPGEVQVGIVMAVVGAPVLIALVRRTKASGL